MQIKIVYDNEALPGFFKAWGFSCLVDLGDRKILFDAGWDGSKLLANLEKMGESPSEIDVIVLSHNHWDHVGGINHLRERESDLWVPASFSNNMKADLSRRFHLHEVREGTRIGDGVWTTGELGANPKEQSLVLRTSEGVLTIVGCSHPGVKVILAAASHFGEPWGIIGGMHGFDDFQVLRDLELVAPLHCTVRKKEILDLFPNKARAGGAGTVFEVE
jgi:7,8-dihydropterin-6-yl-methyl-4-(beta-D-ribofuranosyl)aminobenzene 5'-phosphate synthase